MQGAFQCRHNCAGAGYLLKYVDLGVALSRGYESPCLGSNADAAGQVQELRQAAFLAAETTARPTAAFRHAATPGRRGLGMPRTAGECPAQSVSQSLSGSISALLRRRHQHRGVRSCTVFDSDCDCDSDPDADTDRYSVVRNDPLLFGKDFQVSSTECTVAESGDYRVRRGPGP